MRISIVGGRAMDWDELLCGEFSVAGRDFEPLIPVSSVRLFRGPMGSVLREGDFLGILPQLMVRIITGRPREYVPVPEGFVRLRLTDYRAVHMPDDSLMIADRLLSPAYRFCALGDNVLDRFSLGHAPSD